MAIHGDAPCTAYDLFMQMSDVIFSAQCDGASGMRIAQLEEIVSRALNVNWHEYITLATSSGDCDGQSCLLPEG